MLAPSPAFAPTSDYCLGMTINRYCASGLQSLHWLPTAFVRQPDVIVAVASKHVVCAVRRE